MNAGRVCACGCGTPLTSMRPGVLYINNHWSKGRKRPEEWLRHMAEGIGRAWKDPDKFQAMRNQSAELIKKRTDPLRGKPKSAEHRRNIGLALFGKPLSPEHRAKASKTWWKGAAFLTAEQQQKRSASLSRIMTGTHGRGKGARDNLEHFNALFWVIRDPCGKTHSFPNLQSWAREHESMFLPDAHPESRLPLWFRFVGGINGQVRRDRHGQTHWKGWVLVSQGEIDRGGRDLLERVRENEE